MVQTDFRLLQPASQDFLSANQPFLEAELSILRLRLERRTQWLRQKWQTSAGAAPHGYTQLVSDQQVDWLLQEETGEQENEFYQTATADLTHQIADKLEAQHRQLAELSQAGILPALHWLSGQFGLNAFEQQVLVLCLAPEIESGFADLYAYLQDNASRRYPSAELALQLFTPHPAERYLLRNSFLPEAPLFRYALLERSNALSTVPGIQPGASELVLPLRLPSRLVDLLRGVNRLDEALLPYLRRVEAQRLPPSTQQQAERLGSWLRTNFPTPTCWNLTGPANAGKLACAEAACRTAGMQAARLDLPRLAEVTQAAGQVSSGEWARLRRLLQREAQLSRLGWVIELTAQEPATGGDPAQARVLEDLLEQPPGLLLVLSPERLSSQSPVHYLPLGSPSPDELRWLWQQALAEAPGMSPVVDETTLQRLVQQFDFGPETIPQVVASLAGRLGQPTALDADSLWQACREQAGPQLDKLARRIQPVYNWKDIVLPNDLELQLHEIASQVANRYLVYETWGFGAALSRGRGISALFAGPSGTGKTMAAEILANELHLDLYRIDLSSVVSKYIGETEKNLKIVFDAAETSGAILFFDEADALFGKRTEVKDSHDRYANIEVNYLLQRMEDYRGLAILATNRKTALDRAFMRRLRFLLDFPFPDANYRRRIWGKVFPRQAPLAEGAEGLDYPALARLEIPGGNIRNIALNAAFLAAAEGSPIRMHHVIHAARREYSKIDKMIAPAEFGEYASLLDGSREAERRHA